MERRRPVRAGAGPVLMLVLVLCAAGCGARTDGADPSVRTESPGTAAPRPGSEPAGSVAEEASEGSADATSTAPGAPACPVVRAEDLAAALGSALTLESTGSEPSRGSTWCGFAGPGWTIDIRREPLDPAMTSTVAPMPTLAGVEADHVAWLGLNRSGLHSADLVLAIGSVFYDVTVTNTTQGADTYPPTDGPVQGPATEAAAIAVGRLLAS